MPGIQSFSRILHHFVSAILTTTGIRVGKCLKVGIFRLKGSDSTLKALPLTKHLDIFSLWFNVLNNLKTTLSFYFSNS